MFDLFLVPNAQVLGQLALALLLGMIIGLERSIAHKTAGMRTFALVSMGAALFTIVSEIMYHQFNTAGFDPSRIASQIVVGIGFLAGGIIIFNHEKIQGLTTSAGLWVSGGVGMAVGFGLYSVAIYATILTLVVLSGLWLIEERVVDGLDGRKAKRNARED
jgi:putative Mg2+ transporter-C (MgtC) family protein